MHLTSSVSVSVSLSFSWHSSSASIALVCLVMVHPFQHLWLRDRGFLCHLNAACRVICMSMSCNLPPLQLSYLSYPMDCTSTSICFHPTTPPPYCLYNVTQLLRSILLQFSQIAPTRAVVLRGREADCKEVAAYARANGIEAFSPGNRYLGPFHSIASYLLWRHPI